MFFTAPTVSGTRSRSFKGGATIFGYRVNDPERYGVVEFDARRTSHFH